MILTKANTEIIKTYAGYLRSGGVIKMYITYMYRCKLCGTIKPEKKELVAHQCKPK